MNKKIAHTGLFFFDVICLAGLWFGYSTLVRIIEEISHNVDTIKYGNRVGFFIVCIIMPLLHIVTAIERYWPDFVNKNMKIISQTLIAILVLSITAGFAGSMWINAKVENAGYIYCSKASGVGATSKSLVYTKDMEICEALVASKKAKRTR